MPYGYLTNGIVFAVLVLCAIAPPTRPRPLAELASVLATAINELPYVFGYALLAATALAAVQGDLASAGAWAAFTLNMLNLVGVAVIVAQAARARAVLADALSTVGITMQRRRLPWLRILLWPWRTRPASVRRVANVPYAPGNRRTTLDVYHHRSRPVGGAVLIHLHGGFFRIGRKSTQSMPLLHHLAARGWVCISANYRLHPVPWPAALVDAGRLVAWAHRHAQEYGGDPTTVFLAGSSAGGHLAADVALTPGEDVTAAILLGAYLGPVANGLSSPYDLVRPDTPPFLVVHGRNDSLVPAAQARGFAAALRRAGAQTVVYAELPGTQHGFDRFHSVRFEAIIDAIETFCARVSERRS
jgi:acetyl esterase/lipase